MLRMVSYSRRPQSGHIVCYLNRTYHVLTTGRRGNIDVILTVAYAPRVIVARGSLGRPCGLRGTMQAPLILLLSFVLVGVHFAPAQVQATGQDQSPSTNRDVSMGHPAPKVSTSLPYPDSTSPAVCGRRQSAPHDTHCGCRCSPRWWPSTTASARRQIRQAFPDRSSPGRAA